MYNLAICEIIHPTLHGSHQYYSGHYIVSWFISHHEFMANQYKPTLNAMKKFYWERTTSPIHPLLRAFWTITSQKKYYQVHIVEGLELMSGEQTAIIKTFWLRIFQRKWRNICKERRDALTKIKYLSYRSSHGRWPMLLL